MSRIASIIAIFLACAWSIIAFATTINAVVKSNNDKDRVRRAIPRGARVDIDTTDVFHTGAVITAVSIVIFVVTSNILIFLLVRPKLLLPRTLSILGGTLAFLAVWLFATLVPYTHFFRTRSAIVVATLNNVPLPDQLIHTLEDSLGVSSVYRNLGYLRLVAILPWFALLFTIIAAIFLFRSASHARKSQTTHGTTSRGIEEGTATSGSDKDVKHESDTAVTEKPVANEDQIERADAA